MKQTGTRRRFAVLRSDSSHFQAIDPLCLAIQNSDRHELIAPAGADTPLRPADWRLITEDAQVDAVIVCGHDPQTLEAARQLAIRGVPLIIEVAPSLPGEFVAEMALYDAEGSSTLRPWFPARGDLVAEKRVMQDAPLGTWQSLQIERVVSAVETAGDTTADRELQIDIDWLRLLGGDYSQVTCSRNGTDPDWVTQTVQLAGPGLPDASCIYRRQGAQRGPALRIDGTQNFLETRAEDEEIVVRVGGMEVDRRPHQPDPAQQRERLLRQLDQLWQETPESARWRDVVRIYEIQAAMPRSLKRRRTIDLHFETTSERSQFKTHMATIGCGVILWTMFGIIGLLFAGAVLDPREGMQRESEAAGFVLRDDEFEPDSAELTDAGRHHVEQIAARTSLNEAVVWIEATAPRDGPSQLDEARRAEVWMVLSSAGGEDPNRVVVRPLRGAWFTRVMQLARLLVFAPVGLFLLVQLLLLVAKPAARSHSSV